MKQKFNLITKLKAIEMAQETGNKRKAAKHLELIPPKSEYGLKISKEFKKWP